MFSICKECTKKLTVSGCISCKTFKMKITLNNFQTDINNNIYDEPIILINKMYSYVENILDFKNIPYLVVQNLPDDVVACLADKRMLNI